MVGRMRLRGLRVQVNQEARQARRERILVGSPARRRDIAFDHMTARRLGRAGLQVPDTGRLWHRYDVIIFSGLFTAFGRLIGAVATMTVAWATILLFGRIPQSKQTLLSFITLGSLAWIAALAGVLVPTVGSFLLAAVPRAPFIEDVWLRLVMLGLAAFLPLAIGFATVHFIATEDRPVGRARFRRLLLGYPYAAVYALTIISLAAWGLVRKIRSLQHGWDSVHIPMIVKAGRYDAVVTDLESALHEADLAVARKPASGWFEIPPRLLAAVGGDAVKDLIPTLTS